MDHEELLSEEQEVPEDQAEEMIPEWEEDGSLEEADAEAMVEAEALGEIPEEVEETEEESAEEPEDIEEESAEEPVVEGFEMEITPIAISAEAEEWIEQTPEPPFEPTEIWFSKDANCLRVRTAQGQFEYNVAQGSYGDWVPMQAEGTPVEEPEVEMSVRVRRAKGLE